mgnify:CR=1 FL=1
MNIEHFLNNNAPLWMLGEDENADIVLSTRIRLARNLNNVKFPITMTEEEAKYVDDRVTGILLGVNEGEAKFSYFPMQQLSSLQRQILVEKHLISPNLAKRKLPASVLLTADESVSIMINEEDHIRIQCLAPNLKLVETYRKAAKMDQWLNNSLTFAYDEQFGFLTSCPTNVGTGLRASVMMHLPALTMTKQMNTINQMLARLGMAVRGIYGEGSENLGNIYQISNQITLGKSEAEILEELQSVVEQIIQRERLARQQVFKRASVALEDRLFRSLGTLRYARILTSEEAANCLSDVRLAVDLNLIDDLSIQVLNECMILIQPGIIQQNAGVTLEPAERDLYRAKLVQSKLKEATISTTKGEKGEDYYDV